MAVFIDKFFYEIGIFLLIQIYVIGDIFWKRYHVCSNPFLLWFSVIRIYHLL